MGADDIEFHPRWADIAVRMMRGRVGVVATNDKANRQVMRGEFGTHCLISRAYIDEHGGTFDGTPGVVLHEGYDHNFVVDRTADGLAAGPRALEAMDDSRVGAAGVQALVVVVFSVIQTFSDFQLIYVLTRGGPLNSTHLMATLAFQRAIGGGALGEGAALATLMVPFLLAAIMVSYFGLQRRAWQQGSDK